MHKILVTGGDEDIRADLAAMLERENFTPILTEDAAISFEKLRSARPQLLLAILPVRGLSGVELCKQVRASRIETPIIFLSAIGDEMEKVLLLEIGADDYMTQPFGMRELLARIRAVLRRTAVNFERAIQFGDVEVDPDRRNIRRRGGEVKMTRAEYNLLLFFLQNAERALTRDAILNSVWGYDSYPNTRTVDAHVVRLRQKLELNPSAPRHFLTIHGVGYRFSM